MTFPKHPANSRCSRSRLRRWRPTWCAIAPCSIVWPACASSRSSAGYDPPRRRLSTANSFRRRRPKPSRSRPPRRRMTTTRSRPTYWAPSRHLGSRCRGQCDDRAAQVGGRPGQARRQGGSARARPHRRRVPAAAARHPGAAVQGHHRDQDRRGRARAERPPARDRARRFRCQGPDREGAAGPGRDALRARARARHQVEPGHRPRRRYRPLDERGVGARRLRAGPQRDRHRAAQCAARDGVPSRALSTRQRSRTAGSACRWSWARTSAAIR